MNHNILHIEDYDEEKQVDYRKKLHNESIKKNLTYDWTDNLQDAKKKIDENNFDIFILDGQFPEVKGAKPSKSNFYRIYSFIVDKGISKEKIIVWSNSTTIHNYCYDSAIRCYSKKKMSPEDYIIKGNNPARMVESIGAQKLADEISIKIKK